MRDPGLAIPVLVGLLAACGSQRPVAPLSPAARTSEEAPSILADVRFVEQYAKTRGFTLGRPGGIRITPEGDAVLFLRSGPESFERDLWVFDPATRAERVLLTAQEILRGADEELPPEERARRERMRMAARGIATYSLSEDGRLVLVPLSGRLFVVERATGRIQELRGSEGYPVDPRFSPDGRRVACVRNGDLYVFDVASGEERRLTSNAGGTIENALAEFVAQEEMGRFEGYWWGPDGETIAYQQNDSAGVEVLHLGDPAHPELEPRPTPYPRAGRANVKVRLGILPVAGGETTWVAWDVERYPYLARVAWEENAPLTILVQNRRQTEEVLLEVDPSTGRTSSLLVERDEAWLNLDGAAPRWLEDGASFLWTTERGGAWQLEHRARDGRLIDTLTPPDLGYRSLLGVDEERGVVWVQASSEPTEAHLFRVPLDPARGRPVRTTGRPGEHGAVFAKNHALWVHHVALREGFERDLVRRRDGQVVGTLRSVAAEPPFRPNVELTTVGEREFRAAVIRPRNFQAGRRYPVVVSVYAGPHARVVQAAKRRYLFDQWIADHGLVVVRVDGRGTPGRGRAWERAIRGNFVEVPLEDQVAGLRALGEKYPELDLSRVAIHGWSFGGYMAVMAVLKRPDVFHAAVAGAPVVDWRDYDTHYTERYLGLPDENAAGYEASSALTYAASLERPLLVIHGTMDDNVLFLHSLKLSDALFRAGREHGFLPLSGLTHMVPDPVATRSLDTRIVDFLRRSLGANGRSRRGS